MDTTSRTDALPPCGPGRTVVAVFDDRFAAEQAADALLQAGFAADTVGYAIRGSDAIHGGMITDAQGTKDGKGAATGMVAGGVIGGVLAAAAAMIPVAGPVLAGGVLAAFFGGAVAGTAVGGIVGAMAGLGVSEDEAQFYQRYFNEGKAIVAVRAGDRFADAIDLLTRRGGQHVNCQVQSPVQTDGVFSMP